MKKIKAITVSKNYSGLLELCIKQNHQIFDKWYIVTQEDDLDTIELIKKLNYNNIELCYYPLVPNVSKHGDAKMPFTGNDAKLLYRNGTHDLIEECKLKEVVLHKDPKNKSAIVYSAHNQVFFDKGGAIRYVQKYKTKPGESVLILDSDILITERLKNILLSYDLQKDMIYGSLRMDFITPDDPEGVLYPRSNQCDGYFQLYVNSEKYLYSRSTSAGICDWHFSQQFPHAHVFQEYCHHIGDRAKNWLGVNKSAELIKNLKSE